MLNVFKICCPIGTTGRKKRLMVNGLSEIQLATMKKITLVYLLDIADDMEKLAIGNWPDTSNASDATEEELEYWRERRFIDEEYSFHGNAQDFEEWSNEYDFFELDGDKVAPDDNLYCCIDGEHEYYFDNNNAMEQFIADHVREQTAACRKIIEDYAVE